MKILYASAYYKMGLINKDLKPANFTLYSFIRDSLMPQGRIELVVIMGEYSLTSNIMADFLVIEGSSAYNALFEIPILKDLKAVTLIYHLGVKFPTSEGIGYVQGCQYKAQECYNQSLKIASKERKLPQTLVIKQRPFLGGILIERSLIPTFKLTSQNLVL